MRPSRALPATLAVALALAPAAAAAGEAPARVVSLNLCTDQLAMLLAAPGQIAALSHVARDPRASAMAAEAMAYPLTHGGAEEVFALAPDLVLAGTYTTRATVDLLRRLGVAVVEVPPPGSIAAARAAIVTVGAALGREAAAAALLAGFDAGLARLAAPPGPRPQAAIYGAAGWTGGAATLSGEILARAGLANLAAELGLAAGGYLPLERLVLAGPALLVLARPYPGASRAEELLAHPALAALAAGRPAVSPDDADWVCGTPHLLRALAALRAARDRLPEAR